MAPQPPDAFLSYTRFDDQHDGGAISQFRLRLASAVRAVTGEPFEIFQDVDGIGIGEHWPRRLDGMLDEVRFFIPIITPSYFRSSACRNEIEQFLHAEADSGRDDLVLPIYYIESDVLEDEELRAADPLAKIIHERQRQDWRELRFEPIDAKGVRKELERLAREIVRGRRRSMRRIAEPQTGAKVAISAASSPQIPTAVPPPHSVALPRRAAAGVAAIFEYDGDKFRSRAVAQWAAFLQAVGLNYQHRVEGYNLDGTWYVPDFWLAELGFWLDVGDDEPTEEWKQLCQLLADKSGCTVLFAIGAPRPRDHIMIFPTADDSGRWSGPSFHSERGARLYFADDRRNEGQFWLVSDKGAAFSIGPQIGPDHGKRPGVYNATRIGYDAAQRASMLMRTGNDRAEGASGQVGD